MKKIYLLAGALFAASGVYAQGFELFFSAYNEGAHPSGSIAPGGSTPSEGSERAIQIFNPTTAVVNMDQYSVARYSNGSNAVFQEERTKRNMQNGVPSTTAPNTLPSGDVFVMGSFKATLPEIVNNMDQRATDYGPITNATVLTQGGPIFFDGNDAMVLRRWTGGMAGQGTPVIVDIFGVIGNDPGAAGWRTPVTGGVDPEVKSRDQSLVRKSWVSNGIKTNPNIANYQIGDQWETFSAYDYTGTSTNTAPFYAQDYSNLISHAGRYSGGYGSYAPVGVLEDFNKALTVFPNPASQTVKIRIENTKVNSITILNALGQNIQVAPTAAVQNEISVDISSLKPGLYFVKFVGGNDYNMCIYKELLVR